MTAYLEGYDISGPGQGRWTPSPAGLAFAIVKASEGNFTDSAWAIHVNALKTHQGLAIGAYHFGRRDVTVTEQVDTYLRTVDDLVEFDVLDYEYATDRTLMTQVQARAFIKGVKAQNGGRPVGLYGAEFSPWRSFPADNWGADFAWIANTSKQPGHPWTFWQYTFTPFDHDYFNGDQAAFAKFLGQSTGGVVAMTNRSGYPKPLAVKKGDPFYAKAGDSAPIGTMSSDATLQVQGRVVDPGGGWYEAWITTSAGYADNVDRPSGVYLHLAEPVTWAGGAA